MIKEKNKKSIVTTKKIIMKNIILSLSLFLIIINCKAQQLTAVGVVPLENYNSFVKSHNGIPDGTYFKDVNHVLDKYEGTWEGTYHNKTYTITINKAVKIPGVARHSLKYDKLYLRYKITDNTSGNILRNTLNDSRKKASVGLSLNVNDSQWYDLAYAGNENNSTISCGDAGTIHIKYNSINSKIELYISPSNAFFDPDDCPNGYQAPPFPKYTDSHLILTKTGPAPNPPGGGLQLDPKYQ